MKNQRINQHTHLFFFVFLVALLASTSLSATDIYKKTINGITSYSDRPLPGFSKVGSALAPEAATPEEAPTSMPINPDNCLRAQTNLEALMSQSDVATTVADGKKVVLSSSEKEKAIALAKGEIGLYCAQ